MSLHLVKQPADISFSKNPIEFIIEDDNCDYGELLIIPYAPFNTVSLSATPDENQRLSFRLEQVLDSMLNWDLLAADTSNNVFVSKSIWGYTLQYRSYKDGQLSITQYTNNTKGFKFVMGGVTPEVKLDFFQDYLQPKKQFLTWLRSKTVAPDQPEFLHFLNCTDSDLNSLQVVVHKFKDNGTSETFVHETIPVLDDRKAVIIPVGFNQLDLGDQFSKVHEYTVKLVSGSFESEEYRFYVDYKPRQETRYILFANSLSGVQTLRCVGRSKNRFGVKKGAFEAGEILGTFGHSGQEKVAANSGYISREELESLRDLLLTEHVVELIGGNYFPILIDVRSFIEYRHTENLFSLAFSYTYQYKQQVYTPRIPDLFSEISQASSTSGSLAQ